MKTIVFTDFPLSDFALRAFCRLQKQKTSMTLRIFLSRGRRVFFSFFSLLASQFLFSQRSPLSFLFLFTPQVRVNNDRSQPPPCRPTWRRSHCPSGFWTPRSLCHLPRYLPWSHFRHLGFHLEPSVAPFHRHLPTHSGLRSQRRRHGSWWVESDVSFCVHRHRFLNFASRVEFSAERSRAAGFLIMCLKIYA